ncbi:MAG: glycerophosphodiester phosphodiesterase family protein [Flavobacteriaceae bacterium]
MVRLKILSIISEEQLLSLKKYSNFGVTVRDVLAPKKLSSPTSRMPTDTDGAFLEVFFNDAPNINANKQFFYGAFATEEKNGQQEGYWKLKSPKFGNSLYSNDFKINLFNRKVRMVGEGFEYSDEPYPLTIKITVRNCTLVKLNIPGFTEFEALRLVGLGEVKNTEELMNIIQSPTDFDYTWVIADGGLWGQTTGKNTMKAFELAVEAGADILGVDTRLTKDEKLVACSGTYLDKWYDITELAIRKGIPPNELRILDITENEFLQLKVKNKEGQVLLGSHPCSVDELNTRFPVRFFQFNPYDDNFLIFGQYELANDLNSYKIQEMKIQALVMGFKLQHRYASETLSVVHIPLFNSPEANELQVPDEYINLINVMAMNYQFATEDIWPPYIVMEPNLNPYVQDNLFLKWLAMTNRFECNFKTNTDALLDSYFISNLMLDVNVSIYSLYADDPLGRSYTNKYGNRGVFEYKPDTNGDYNTDLSLDNRGNLDWVMEKNITNMIATPRPDMVIKFLESQGMRSRKPK